MNKYLALILIFLYCVRTNGLYRNNSLYDEYSYDEYDEEDYHDDYIDNITNKIEDIEQEPATEDMYESDLYYYRHKPTFGKKYLNDHVLTDTNVIYDENWPYPEENEIGFNVSSTVSRRFRCGTCKCGRRISKRIIGGIYTTRKRYPWMVLLALRNSLICGASLINSRYILTAAHCTRGNKVTSLTARFRTLKRSNVSIPPPTFVRKISKYWIHSRFTTATFDYDISLCKLRRRVNSFKLILPICLPGKQGRWGGKDREGYVTGWGVITGAFSTPIYSNQLKQVKVPIVTNPNCNRRMPFYIITPRMICAGVKGKAACDGDGGAPLIVTYNRPFGRAKQLGWLCGLFPGVYTRVPKFVDWIKNRANKGACWCS